MLSASSQVMCFLLPSCLVKGPIEIFRLIQKLNFLCRKCNYYCDPRFARQQNNNNNDYNGISLFRRINCLLQYGAYKYHSITDNEFFAFYHCLVHKYSNRVIIISGKTATMSLVDLVNNNGYTFYMVSIQYFSFQTELDRETW